jgi:hypothetical protein
MGDIVVKEEEEALFTSKKKGSPRGKGRPNLRWVEGDKHHPKERSSSSGGARG